jgi:hypothetical protein
LEHDSGGGTAPVLPSSGAETFLDMNFTDDQTDSEYHLDSDNAKSGSTDDDLSEEGCESEIEEASSSEIETSAAEHTSPSAADTNIDQLWKTDPWAALHKIVGTISRSSCFD